MARRRSYAQEFDYNGVAAVEAEYDDGFDSWDEIAEAFKKSDEIILKRSHGDVRNVGIIKHWDLDKTNKKVYIGFNKEDVDEDIKFDEINNVSIEYETLKGKIVGVNHICVGNTFQQKCKKDVCSILKKQRGDEPTTEPDTTVEEPDVEEEVIPDEEPEGSENEEKEEISNKILLDEIKLLKTQIEEKSKAKDKLEPEPEDKEDKKKLKLGFQDKLKHELPSKENEAENAGLSRKWNFINN
ncbi:hypothetical protein LCGC14_0720410 [marine sediment metagenome]|uniref:Uncharacterized protein n=1 Tax=marine sediment metagenome TaxID=412755 RepID=A0A0F9TJY5_9ZZZZ